MACHNIRSCLQGVSVGHREMRPVATVRSYGKRQRLWDKAMQWEVKQKFPLTSHAVMKDLKGCL